MSTTKQRGKHNDALALQGILREFEQASANYNAVLAEVSARQEQMAKDRAALAALRTRLIGMRESLKAWDNSLWDMGWREGVPREACAHAERQIKAHERRLNDLIWQLYEFKEEPEVAQP
jgi:chromosome segregation ATPase